MASPVSLRTIASLLAVFGAAALTPIGQTTTPDFGEPMANLTLDELERFDLGLDEFTEVETVPGCRGIRRPG